MATNITATAPVSVFITGATGALGREVTRRLTAAGHHVTGATTGYENAALVRADGGIPSYPDLMRAGEMRSVMQAAKAEVVINLAPQIANHVPQMRGAWDARLMDEGVAALLDAAQAVGVKYVVHTSYAFAGAHSEALEDLLHAVKAGEHRVLSGSIPGCVLRMGFVYGAQSPELIAVRDALMMGKMIDCGPDNSHACWTNVPDAASAIMLAVEKRPSGGGFNIADDQTVSPAGFLRYFAQVQGVTPPGRAPRYAMWAQPSKEQVAVMSLSPHAGSEHAKENLGWQPRFPSYREAIDDALLSWRAVEVK